MMEQRRGGFLIAKIHQVSGRIFSRILKQHNITEINPAQGRILFVLWEHDEITITELSRKTQLEKSTLTAMLDRLEHDGFIRRMASEKDRRKTIIKRTDKDKSFQQEYYQISDEMTALFYKDFSEKDIDRFEEYLGRILDNLMEPGDESRKD
jgi:DNA-binding MarR family transcriptional regulator